MKTNKIQMLRTISFEVILCSFILSMVGTSEARQKEAKLDTQVQVNLNYLVYLPENYDQKKSWPLVLFLHGAGERGENLEKVKVHGPPKLVKQGKEFPFILISPQCPTGGWWNPIELTALLDSVEGEYKVDKDREYLTGLSMGGYGTWSLVSHTPKRFAAIIPVCGAGIPYLVPTHSNVPTWVFHGEKDSVIPLARSEEMVKAYKSKKGSIQFTVYPETDHDSWTATYNNPEIYSWLLSNKRVIEKK